jgi:hypothetical protein
MNMNKENKKNLKKISTKKKWLFESINYK